MKAAKVVEHELAEPVAPSGDFEASQAVSRAYARWLKARAAIKSDFPEDEKAMQALYKDSTDSLVSFALGCIKSDLLSLGIGRGQ